MIVVTPTFYPDDNASLDLHYAGQLDRAFPRELPTPVEYPLNGDRGSANENRRARHNPANSRA
jgi:hypothetical protein